MFTPSTIHNIHARLVDGQLSPYTFGISRKTFDTIREMVRSEKKNVKVVTVDSINQLDIFTEQLLEEARLKEKLHRVIPTAKPYPIMVVEADDAYALQVRIYAPDRPNMSAKFSVTYNGNHSPAFRANAYAWVSGKLEAAREDPYRFFED